MIPATFFLEAFNQEDPFFYILPLFLEELSCYCPPPRTNIFSRTSSCLCCQHLLHSHILNTSEQSFCLCYSSQSLIGCRSLNTIIWFCQSVHSLSDLLFSDPACPKGVTRRFLHLIFTSPPAASKFYGLSPLHGPPLDEDASYWV